MAVTIQNIIQLPEFENCSIVAGKEYLKRLIYQVSVIEHPVVKSDIGKFGRPGDFYLTGLYAYKDKPEELLGMISLLIEDKSEALCYINSCFTNLPKEVIDFANLHHFTIIMISKDIPYSNIITKIMELIIRNKEESMLELRFKSLMDKNLPLGTVREIVYGINESFMELTIAVLIKQKKGIQISPTNFWKEHLLKSEYIVSPFDDKLLVILTFPKSKQERLRSIRKNILDRIVNSEDIQFIGSSSPNNSLDKMRQCINEASEALETATLTKQKSVMYDEMGIYKLLTPIRNFVASENYSEKIVNMIKEYDMKYNTQLYDTALIYVECQCDVKMTSERLYIHENTIRYRIKRIKELLEMEHLFFDFNEMLSIAIKLHKLIR